MRETALKVMALSERIPDLNLQIDPTAFERFGIHQVPALVVSQSQAFDVIYGHLPITEGLSRMAARGDSGFSALDARQVSGE
jgi:conjugal transfer pilus assembly protein TrbC